MCTYTSCCICILLSDSVSNESTTSMRSTTNGSMSRMSVSDGTGTGGLAWCFALFGFILLATAIGLLIAVLIQQNNAKHYAQHHTCLDPGTLSTRCNDFNPCTADKILLDNTCVNRDWPFGTPCNSTCLVPTQRSAVCIEGQCEALQTDCRGYCPYTFTEDCDATDPACLAMVGCPALPLGVSNTTQLPAGIDGVRAACVLHSCRYGVFTVLPTNVNGSLVAPTTSAACSEWLNRSTAGVREGCYDAVRIVFGAADYLNTPAFVPPDTYVRPVNLTAAVACTYSFHCAPYDTTLTPPVISASVSRNAAAIASVFGRGVETGSVAHNVYSVRSYIGMASRALFGL